VAVVRRVRERAGHQCEYCQTAERISGQPCEVDHILPRVRGGETVLENLCLACAPCNSFKLDQIEAIDPQTGETAALFNPRIQTWTQHFAWTSAGTLLIGLSACGRATMVALHLNRPLIVAARSIWVSAKLHPPG
jgi:HNH endonuclease